MTTAPPLVQLRREAFKLLAYMCAPLREAIIGKEGWEKDGGRESDIKRRVSPCMKGLLAHWWQVSLGSDEQRNSCTSRNTHQVSHLQFNPVTESAAA